MLEGRNTMRIRLAAVGLALACAPAVHADILIYQFHGTVNLNGILSGGFAGAPIGSSVMLQFTIDTTTTPVFTNPTRHHWDGVAGTMLGMQATVNGFTSIVTPNSAPDHARVVNDAFYSSSSFYSDEFWIEASAVGAAPDFVLGFINLTSQSAAAPTPSPLLGLDWPDDNAEVNPAGFNHNNQMILRLVGPQYIAATIDSVTVLPTPGAFALCSIAALATTRRRRRA